MGLQSFRSRTAESAAVSRAVSALEPELSDRNPDALAEQLIGRGYRGLLRSRYLRAAISQLMEAVAPGMMLYQLARTRHFDALLRAELAAGLEQVVILSAGLDSRAHRFAGALDAAVVYEVDHPRTSAWKQRVVRERLPGVNLAVRYVAVDLVASDLFAALDDAGFSEQRRTFFLWEGASAYLPPNTVRALLASIASRMGAASIALDYMYRSMLEAPERFRGGRRHMAAVRWAGEPCLFGCDPIEMEELCTSLGYEVLSNCDANSLATRHLPSTPEAMAKYFGIVHARTHASHGPTPASSSSKL
jgi:methyltransferase (TIGR00027 family)